MSAEQNSRANTPIFLATRGSALALAQTNMVLAQCRAAFPELSFEIKIIKTTGDKLQTAPPDVPAMPGAKGLFTKELEVALLNGEADLAVHSLKDLPTDLPEGLELAAVLPRADVRDVLIYRDANSVRGRSSGEGRPGNLLGLPPGARIGDFPAGSTIATSSTRRQAQLLALRPELKVVPIRGNVGTRLQKLAERAELDGLVLAAAGLHRLHFKISEDGLLHPPPNGGSKSQAPAGLRAVYLSIDEMVPCVGQGAIGLEGRRGDAQMQTIFERLNDPLTLRCVTAERSFLHALGGGCLSPVAAYAEAAGGQIRLRAVSFRGEMVRRTQRQATLAQAAELGIQAAEDVR
jgi:hydroxymethylbilane synthase